MQLEHEFEVPVPVEQAWDLLLDVERIAPCMPGATVESFDGETIEGRAKVKVGPTQVTYVGTAKFVDKDEQARRAVIDASAKEARGVGTAQATIVAVLHGQGSSTKVIVTTDLAITGRPAQFGRGVMAEVGNKILGKFADCLAADIGSGPRPTSSQVPPAQVMTGAETAAAADGIAVATSSGARLAHPGPSTTPLRPLPADEPLDQLHTAGAPVLKRVAPLFGAALLFIVVWRLVVRPRG